MVIQEQYEKLVGENPSTRKSPKFPVEKTSWFDATEYCKILNKKFPPANGYVYRLPTEAEWEYACRAGTTTKCSFGDGESYLREYVWYRSNSTYPKSGGFWSGLFKEGSRHHHPVGQKKPNPWGLYDMHGNVWEWCQDWCDDYPSGSVTDPTGAASGSFRVDRGGCWFFNSDFCRSALRDGSTPGRRINFLGFRVLRSSIK